jgi:hypothetical protein
MTAKHYKEVLLSEYESQELSIVDFQDTLEFYTKLVIQEERKRSRNKRLDIIIPFFLLLSMALQIALVLSLFEC